MTHYSIRPQTLYYSPEVFYTFPSSMRDSMIEHSREEENYEAFAHLLTLQFRGSEPAEKSRSIGFILADTIQALDSRAVSIICSLENAKNEIENYHLEMAFNERENAPQKAIDIFNILINAKASVNSYDLSLMSQLVDSTTFDAFCQSKNIALTSPEFEALNLSHYKTEKPLKILPEASHCANTVDLILSRTYSNILSADMAKSIYQKLLTADPIATQMLSYLAMQIDSGDSIKITFAEGENSFYYPRLNTIKIDTRHLNEHAFSIDSVLIHEIGHYFYDHLFDNRAVPYYSDLRSLPVGRDKLSPELKLLKELEETFAASTLDTIEKNAENLFATGSPIYTQFSMLLDYAKASKMVTYKAAGLLQLDTQPMDKLLLPHDDVNYLKDHSIINVFYLNAIVHNNFEEQVRGPATNYNWVHALDPALVKSLLDIYLQDQMSLSDQCSIENYLTEELTPQKLEDWALEVFLPRVVGELGLNETHIHFLERIADYANRAESTYYNFFSPTIDFADLYRELIVRYAELKVAGIESDLLQSFDGVRDFHNRYASPVAEKELEEYYARCNRNEIDVHTMVDPSHYEVAQESI